MTTQILPLTQPHQLVELEPRTVHAMMCMGDAILIDVREASEFENERIAGAFLSPLSFFDAEHFPSIPSQTVILMCAVGKRSAAAAKQLINAGFETVYHMKGGLNSWKDVELPTDTD